MKHALPMAVAAAVATPAHADIIESTSSGFATQHSAVVMADRAEVWNELLHPERWWAHTWSNDTANLRLEATAGGCFCETIPAADGWPAGSVEHMRVVSIMPGSLLRMSGSLGPLQTEGLVGTLSVTLEDAPDGEGTRITWRYVTGGQAGFDLAQIAPVVDRVQGELLGGLVGRLGGALLEG